MRFLVYMDDTRQRADEGQVVILNIEFRMFDLRKGVTSKFLN